ncbi:MAG: MFS transporter [Chloroflexi bacterium]|nr:MFS transporter [Chloroflexota bacterium]
MPDHPHRKRIFRLGVAEGFFFQTGMSTSHESLVLSVLLKMLGAPTAIIGSLPAIRFAGWSLPQVLVANALESRRYRMPVYSFGNGVRFPLYFILAALVAFLSPQQPGLTIGLFLVIYALGRITAGIGAAARSEILAKVLAPGDLTQFFAMRDLAGSIGGFLTGFLISAILGERGLAFPWNFAALLTLSGVLFGLAWVIFCRIPEPPTEQLKDNCTLATQFGEIRTLVRQDGNYRQYLWVRLCLAAVQIVSPFYALYAIDRLQIETALVGVYLSAVTFSHMVASPLWGQMGKRWGSPAILRGSALLSALAPLVAVVLPILGSRAGWLDAPAFAYLYALVFLVTGAATPGREIGFTSYLLAIAPPERRPTYIGLTNTLHGVLELATIGVGQAIDSWDYAPIFVAAAIIGVVGAALAWQLKGRGQKQ